MDRPFSFVPKGSGAVRGRLEACWVRIVPKRTIDGTQAKGAAGYKDPRLRILPYVGEGKLPLRSVTRQRFC